MVSTTHCNANAHQNFLFRCDANPKMGCAMCAQPRATPVDINKVIPSQSMQSFTLLVSCSCILLLLLPLFSSLISHVLFSYCLCAGGVINSQLCGQLGYIYTALIIIAMSSGYLLFHLFCFLHFHSFHIIISYSRLQDLCSRHLIHMHLPWLLPQSRVAQPKAPLLGHR